jgi:hypothetical protein
MLNPRWIEALMGLPVGWCELATGQGTLFDRQPGEDSLSTNGSHIEPSGWIACPITKKP